MAEKANRLSHTKYHIVLTSKYRRKVVFNQYRKKLEKIFCLTVVAYIMGKLRPKAQFLAMKPEWVCWRPATMKIIFCFYSRLFSKKE